MLNNYKTIRSCAECTTRARLAALQSRKTQLSEQFMDDRKLGGSQNLDRVISIKVVL